jgi:hypothetical protein
MPDSAAEFYLRAQRDELEWIRQAVQTTELGADVICTAENMLTRIRFVRDAWIQDQLDYFGGKSGNDGKAELNRKADARCQKWGSICFSIGIALTLITALFHGFFADLSKPDHDWLMHCLIFGFCVSFSASGLIKVYREIKAFDEHAKLYERMHLALQLTLPRLDAAIQDGNISLALTLIRQLGVEALSENGNWLLMHRERPVLVRGIG